MNAYFKGGLWAAFFVLCGGGLWLAFSGRLSADSAPKQYTLLERMESEGAPPLELPLMDGTPFRLSSLKGKVVVVNFWASWCNPCVQEFPSLLKLLKEMNGDVELVAVSVDEDPSDVETFLKALRADEPRLHVVRDPKRTAADAWGVGKIPESFLLDADGKLIRKVMGIDDWSSPGALGYFKELVQKGPQKR